ncbi:MAG: ACT domain-containing protein [Candidatus Micrarchaeota archaeon]
MKQVTLINEDRVGLLCDISYVLGKSKVNIESLDVEVVGGKALVTLLVKDPKKTMDVLNNNGFMTTTEDSILVKVPNNPGAVHSISDRLAKEDINIESLSVLSSSPAEGVFVLKVDKHRKAKKVLADILLSSSLPDEDDSQAISL